MHFEAAFEGTFELGQHSSRLRDANGLRRIQSLNLDAAHISSCLSTCPNQLITMSSVSTTKQNKINLISFHFINTKETKKHVYIYHFTFLYQQTDAVKKKIKVNMEIRSRCSINFLPFLCNILCQPTSDDKKDEKDGK